jgi:hypothetical protein
VYGDFSANVPNGPQGYLIKDLKTVEPGSGVWKTMYSTEGDWQILPIQ